MSVQLVILGFLRERDYHGYELKKEIQRNMGQWTDIKFGSIYHALKKLVERSSVEKVGEEHHIGKPDRTIYRITQKGEEEFLARLRELLNRIQRIYPECNIGLYFANNLPTDELNDIISRRQIQFEDLKKMLGDVKQMPVHRKLPRISEVIVDHSILHLDAEVKWLKMVKQRLVKEDLYSVPDGEDV